MDLEMVSKNWRNDAEGNSYLTWKFRASDELKDFMLETGGIDE